MKQIYLQHQSKPIIAKCQLTAVFDKLLNICVSGQVVYWLGGKLKMKKKNESKGN